MSQTPNPANPRIAVILARWHANIVDEAYVGLQEELERLRPQQTTLERFDVPGAFEIPLLARRLAQTGQYDAIIGAAFVVDGGIYRHDFVSSTVVDGLMRAQMDADVPVLSCVLTPHNFQETPEHIAFFTSHFRVKGAEAARAVLAVTSIKLVADTSAAA